MQFYLKVSQKGQVILPKRLRETLQVIDVLEVDLQDKIGVIKKPENMTRNLAGCFRKQAVNVGISVDQALDKAREVTAHEIAKKNR